MIFGEINLLFYIIWLSPYVKKRSIIYSRSFDYLIIFLKKNYLAYIKLLKIKNLFYNLWI
jgi:hypothetical protein